MNALKEECLLCCSPIELQDHAKVRSEHAELFSNLFSVFSNYMKWELREGQEFNFKEELFPFCKACLLVLIKIARVHERVQALLKELDALTIQATGKILLSEPERGAAEVLEKGSRVRSKYNQEKVQSCRNLTLKRYLPSVRCARVDDLVQGSKRGDHDSISSLLDSFQDSAEPEVFEDEDEGSMEAVLKLWKHCEDEDEGEDSEAEGMEDEDTEVKLEVEDTEEISKKPNLPFGNIGHEFEIEPEDRKQNENDGKGDVEREVSPEFDFLLDDVMEVHHEEEVMESNIIHNTVNSEAELSPANSPEGSEIENEEKETSPRIYRRSSNRLKFVQTRSSKCNNRDPKYEDSDVEVVSEEDEGSDEDMDSEDEAWDLKGRKGQPRESCPSVQISDTEYMYRGHRYEVIEDGQFKCCLCGSRFSSKSNILQHILKSHVDRPNVKHRVPLEQVGENVFKYGNKWTYSVVNGRHQCGHCPAAWKLPKCIRRHIREAHMGLSTPCSIRANYAKKEAVGSRGDHIPWSKLSETEFKYGDVHTCSLVDGRYCCGHCPVSYKWVKDIRQHIRQAHMGISGKRKNYASTDPVKSRGDRFSFTKVSETEFIYGDDHTCSFVDGRYYCGHCPVSCNRSQAIREHIRLAHMSPSVIGHKASNASKGTVTSQGERFSFIKISETEFKYGDDHTCSLVDGRYCCGHCPVSYKGIKDIREHIRQAHMGISGKQKHYASTDPVTSRGDRFSFTKLSETEFKYGDDHTCSFVDGRYYCGHCQVSYNTPQTIRQHIRLVHMSPSVIDQKASNASTGTVASGGERFSFIKISDNEFTYGDDYTCTFVDGRYHCGHCPVSYKWPKDMREHIRQNHMGLPTTPLSIRKLYRTGNKRPEHIISIVQLSKNEFKYGEEHSYSFANGRYQCGHCHNTRRIASCIRSHIRESHMGLETKKGGLNLKRKELKERRKTEESRVNAGEDIPVTQAGENQFQYGDSHSYSLIAGRYLCGHCPSSWGQTSDIQKHIRETHMDPAIPSSLNTETAEETALLEIGQIKVYQPKLDEEVSGSEGNSNSNQYSYEILEDGYKCCTCEFVAKNYGILIYHIRYKHVYTGMVHVCEICGKGFNVKKNFNLHQVVHLEKRDFICEHCGKDFKCRPSLQSHKKQVHADQSERKIVCEYCGKKFWYAGLLKAHMQTAHSIGNRVTFTCEVCGLTLSRFDKTRHMRSHNRDLCPECPECGKKYVSKTNLKDHIASHHGIKAYSCGLCGVRRTWKSSLLKHLRIAHKITSAAEYRKRCKEVKGGDEEDKSEDL